MTGTDEPLVGSPRAGAPPRGRGRIADGRDTRMTRAEIARTALGLIDRHGVDGLTMRALADELKVSPRAPYNHFPNKAAVVAGVLEVVWDDASTRMVAAMADAGISDPFEYLVIGCVELRREFLEHPEVALYVATLPQPGDRLQGSVEVIMGMVEIAGFPDPVRTYERCIHHVYSAIALSATRRMASAYFGRSEDRLEAWAATAWPDPDDRRRAALRTHYREMDETWFELSLRELLDLERRPDHLEPPPE